MSEEHSAIQSKVNDLEEPEFKRSKHHNIRKKKKKKRHKHANKQTQKRDKKKKRRSAMNAHKPSQDITQCKTLRKKRRLEEQQRQGSTPDSSSCNNDVVNGKTPTLKVNTADCNRSSQVKNKDVLLTSAKNGSATMPTPSPLPSNSRRAVKPVSDLISKLKKSQEIQTYRKMRSALKTQFTCAICCDIMYKPVTTPCGHSFCQACLLHMAATGGNLSCVSDSSIMPLSGIPTLAPGVSCFDVLQDFKCPLCRTSLPGFVSQTGVNVTLWSTINVVFEGHIWQHRSQHETALAQARTLPVGAWTNYYRQRLGKIVDNIEAEREMHGEYDGDDMHATDGHVVVTEAEGDRFIVQTICKHPHDRFRRLVVALTRFPRRPPVAGQSFSVAAGLLDMEEDEVDDCIPQMVRGDDSSLLSNARDSMVMKLFHLQMDNPHDASCKPAVVYDEEDQTSVLTSRRIASLKPSKDAIVKEETDLYDGQARFEISTTTPGRYRIELVSNPSGATAHIDFIVWSALLAKQALSHTLSDNDDSSAPRLNDIFNSDDDISEDDVLIQQHEEDESDDSFVVSDGYVSEMSDPREMDDMKSKITADNNIQAHIDDGTPLPQKKKRRNKHRIMSDDSDSDSD